MFHVFLQLQDVLFLLIQFRLISLANLFELWSPERLPSQPLNQTEEVCFVHKTQFFPLQQKFKEGSEKASRFFFSSSFHRQSLDRQLCQSLLEIFTNMYATCSSGEKNDQKTCSFYLVITQQTWSISAHSLQIEGLFIITIKSILIFIFTPRAPRIILCPYG